ncbi:hypothetical protein NMY22_g17442 [Coprinellus aureogranulatus]|nr:hypothetical protein NMY22_g17442 [Coprinellus aureogranulatus]
MTIMFAALLNIRMVLPFPKAPILFLHPAQELPIKGIAAIITTAAALPIARRLAQTGYFPRQAFGISKSFDSEAASVLADPGQKQQKCEQTNSRREAISIESSVAGGAACRPYKCVIEVRSDRASAKRACRQLPSGDQIGDPQLKNRACANFSPSLDLQGLKQHFQQKGAPAGTITDAKVSFKPDGTSRRFGFVGYKTPQEAAKAQEWFNKTFIDSARLDVKVVEEKGHEPAPRPNKRARTGPSPSELTDSKSKPTTPAEPAKGNRQLDQFMEVMQPRTKKGPSWANDAATAEPVIPEPAALPAPTREPTGDEDVAMEDATEEAPAAEPISDMDWLKQRVSSNVDKVVEEKAFEQSDDEDDTKDRQMEVEQPKAEERKDPVKETILQTSRLFVRNLTFSCTEEELSEHFRPYGENPIRLHLKDESS